MKEKNRRTNKNIKFTKGVVCIAQSAASICIDYFANTKIIFDVVQHVYRIRFGPAGMRIVASQTYINILKLNTLSHTNSLMAKTQLPCRFTMMRTEIINSMNVMNIDIESDVLN